MIKCKMIHGCDKDICCNFCNIENCSNKCEAYYHACGKEVVRHTGFREQKVQELAKKTISISVINDYYFEVYKCPYCKEVVTQKEKAESRKASMEVIKHDPDCAYLIAKELLEGGK